MRIYISGSEDPEKRREISEILVKDGHEVIDGQKGERQSWILSKRGKLTVRLCLIQHCEAIFLIDGWEKNSIARREFNKAAQEKLTICFENGKGVI